jgi:ABC-type bacteriocin/lantibiotic exporter with double-glycine peptidase domain
MFNEKKHEGVFEKSKQNKARFPLLDATVISRILFLWLNRLIIDGYKKQLKSSDMWSLPNDYSCDDLTEKMENYWTIESKEYMNKQKSFTRAQFKNLKHDPSNITSQVKLDVINEKKHDIKQPTLIKCVIKLTGAQFGLSAFFHLIEIVTTYAGPYILGEIVRYIQITNSSAIIAYFFAIILFLSIVIRTIASCHHLDNTFKAGIRIKTGLMGLIYKKSLRLSPTARKDTNVGEMVNLLQVNTQVFENLAPFINMIWSIPLQFIICVVMLWNYLGVASLVGLIPLVVSIPLQMLIALKGKKKQIDKYKFADARIKLISEVFSGIKVK